MQLTETMGSEEANLLIAQQKERGHDGSDGWTFEKRRVRGGYQVMAHENGAERSLLKWDADVPLRT